MAKIGPVTYPTDTTWECVVSDLAPGEHVFTVTDSEGATASVVINVEAAFQELEALPAEQQRPIVEKLAEAFASCATSTDARAGAVTGTGSRSSTVTPVYPVNVPTHATNLQQLLKLWPVAVAAVTLGTVAKGFGEAAGQDLYVLVKGKVLALLAAYQLVSAQPARTNSCDPPPPPVVERHEPAPPPPPPLGPFMMKNKT